jgi:uncharacterized metal-binding protein YceD (DUF177 family)
MEALDRTARHKRQKQKWCHDPQTQSCHLLCLSLQPRPALADSRARTFCLCKGIREDVAHFKKGTRCAIGNESPALLKGPDVTQAPDPFAQISLCAPFRLSALSARKAVRFDISADAPTRTALAVALGIRALRKFTFKGELRPEGRGDWVLEGAFGATFVQDCAITLDPVTTRVDEMVTRRYVTELPVNEGPELEMPEDDSLEVLGQFIDPGAVAIEELVLALPPFPRAAGVELTEDGVLRAAPEGADPVEDLRPRPFAALAQLRDKMAGGTGTDDV